MPDRVPQVGAPDPELKTSPILDDNPEEEEEFPVDQEEGPAVCYFNNVAYPVGQYVRSGSEVLRCEIGGVWVRGGELPPE